MRSLDHQLFFINFIFTLGVVQVFAGDLHLHPPAQHAVVISDLKLDDLSAIHALAREPETKHVHVVGSNLVDHGAAKGHLDNFMNSMKHVGDKYTYYGGESTVVPHDVISTHKQNFVGRSSRPKQKVDDVTKNIPAGSTVDVYHIAPAHPTTVQKLTTNKEYDVRTIHHIQGYNSIVSATNKKRKDGENTHAFLTALAKKAKKAHPNADVLFSNSANSFTDRVGGSTQPLRILKDTFPANHLELATNDPFHHRQLKAIEKNVMSKKRAQGHDLPTLPNVTQKDVRSALYEGNEPLRKQLTHYVRSAIPHIEQHGDKKLELRAKKGVLKALENAHDPMVEMCDGVHVTACLNARRRKDHKAFKPVQFKQTYDAKSDTSFTSDRPARRGHEHGHMLVNQNGSDYARSLQKKSR